MKVIGFTQLVKLFVQKMGGLVLISSYLAIEIK